jgi:hypothetical protein
MDPVAPGILLGLVNTIVIAIGLAVAVPSRSLGASIVMFGFIPGMLIGAFIGGIAGLIAKHPPWVRIVLLTPIPVAFVVVMANMLQLGTAGNLTAIPTLVAVLLLESWSRIPAAGVELPRARAATRS